MTTVDLLSIGFGIAIAGHILGQEYRRIRREHRKGKQ